MSGPCPSSKQFSYASTTLGLEGGERNPTSHRLDLAYSTKGLVGRDLSFVISTSVSFLSLFLLSTFLSSLFFFSSLSFSPSLYFYTFSFLYILLVNIECATEDSPAQLPYRFSTARMPLCRSLQSMKPCSNGLCGSTWKRDGDFWRPAFSWMSTARAITNSGICQWLG